MDTIDTSLVLAGVVMDPSSPKEERFQVIVGGSIVARFATVGEAFVEMSAKVLQKIGA